MNDNKLVIAHRLKEIKDGLENLQGGISTKQFGELLGFVASFLEKPKGDAGEKGEPGKDGIDAVTPVKGKDYYTEDEQRGLVEKIYSLIHTPKKGEDYYTEEEKREVIDSAVKIVQEGIFIPKVGKDYYTEADRLSLIKEISEKIEFPKDLALQEDIKRIEERAVHAIVGDGVRRITVGPFAPKNPAEGDLWVKTT